MVINQEAAMFSRFRPKTILLAVALGLATLLGGCVVYPAYGPGYYGGYGYGWHHHDRW
jgi:hypothetical protein